MAGVERGQGPSPGGSWDAAPQLSEGEEQKEGSLSLRGHRSQCASWPQTKRLLESLVASKPVRGCSPSQTHGLAGAGGDLWRPSGPTPLPKQGHPQPEQLKQSEFRLQGKRESETVQSASFVQYQANKD